MPSFLVEPEETNRRNENPEDEEVWSFAICDQV